MGNWCLVSCTLLKLHVAANHELLKWLHRNAQKFELLLSRIRSRHLMCNVIFGWTLDDLQCMTSSSNRALRMVRWVMKASFRPCFPESVWFHPSLARHRNLAHMLLLCSICSPYLKVLLILFGYQDPYGTHQPRLTYPQHPNAKLSSLLWLVMHRIW